MRNRKGIMWYGVFAENGYGVYSNYNKFLADQKYIRSVRMKSFKSQQEAEEFAECGILSMNGYGYIENIFPDPFRTNYFYFLKADRKNEK